MDSWRFRGGLALMRSKVLRQSFPAAEILVLELRRFQCEAGWPNDRPRLEHERHGVGDALSLRDVRLRRFVEGLRVGPMPAHAVVQARGAGAKTFPPDG